LERALIRLAETDEVYAALKSAMLRAEYMTKVAEALAFKSQTEGTVKEKEMTARLAEPVMTAHDKYFDAVMEFEKCKAQREREMTVIDVWRSLESSRRQGNIQ
jgi:hypothetical protein